MTATSPRRHPRASRPGGARAPVAILALSPALAVVALGVVAAVAIAAHGRSDPLDTMPGGHANMPHYGNDSAATSGTGPMMGGASMMGGNAGTTDPAVLGAREIAIRATSDVFSSSEIHVRAGETVTIALSVSSTSPTT